MWSRPVIISEEVPDIGDTAGNGGGGGHGGAHQGGAAAAAPAAPEVAVGGRGGGGTRSVTAITSSGLVPQVTSGATVVASMKISRSNTASASEKKLFQ